MPKEPQKRALAYLIQERPKGAASGFGRDISMELDDAANALGYRVDRVALKDESASKPLLDDLYHKGYKGILVGPCRSAALGDLIDDRRFSVVQVQRIDPLPFHTVRFSITVDIRHAWRQIRQRGYRKIGCAIPFHSPPIEDDLDRRGAVLNELAELPESESIPPFTGEISDFAGFISWLREYRPDSILSFRVRYYYETRERGIDTHGLGWAMLHLNSPRLRAIGFSGMMQDREALAEQSIRLMDQLIYHDERGVPEKPVNILVSGNWVEGKTLPGPGKRFKHLQDE